MKKTQSRGFIKMKMKKICVLFAAIILAAGMWAYAAEWEVISQNAPAEISSEQMDGEGTDFREPDWDFYYPDYEYNGFIWGVVEVDGVQVDDINDMIGAFVGDECRGIAQQSDNSVQDYAVPFGHVAFMPMVYSNVTSGETLTFKYYDASEDLIWDVSNTLGFTADMVVGNGMEPFIFAVSTTAPAEPHFTPVWEGLADTPLYPHTISVLSATIGGVELVAGDEIAVFDVDGTGNEICVGAMVVSEAAPYAVIASWDHYATPEMDGYIIDHPVIFRIWDASAEAELTEITPTLIPPWTGTYVFNGNTQVILEAAAENIPPVADAGEDQIVIEGDLVQLDGSGSYDPDGETEREPDWSINPPDYEYNGSIWGIVILDGVEVIETTGILGCFVENECRGIATFENGSVLDYTVPFGHIIFLPMVYSNVTGGETITFKYWDANTDMIYDVEETIEWVADMVVGDGFNPFEFTVNTMPTSDLEFLWTAPDGIELSDVNSMMPYFIAPEVDEETMFTFSLIVSDGEAWSEPDEVVITVLNSNLAPVIDLPDFFMFNEDEFLEIDFIAEGYIWDPDDDTLILTHSGNEDIILEITGGVVLFSAPANWFGEEVITFTVDDNETRLTASDDVLVIVNPVNDPPQFDYTETEIVFNEDESAVVDFEEYLFDVDGDELSMYVVGAEVIITEIDGFVITFSAPQDWNGTESIVIGVTDNQDRAMAEISVDIVVLPVNDAPVIDLPEVVEMDEDTTLEFDISPYVNDVDGDELVISDITVYDAGEWEISYSGLVAFIAPGENYYTTCDVQITITDNVTRATAEDVFQLIVHPVNDVPEINLPEMFVFDEDESLEVDFAEYVFDVDGDELVLTVSETENIIVEIAGLMVTFSAPENWFGEELLTFTVDDQVGRAIATADVIITVNSVNDEPVAVPGGPYLAQGDAEGFADIELDGSLSYDIDGEIVSWEWSWLDGYGEGEILIATFEVGETEVTLTVTDNEEGVGTAITTVTVTEYGNIPPAAEADYFEGWEDEAIIGNVLANDVDPDEYPEPLTAELITEPGFGVLEFFADGGFVYTPDANWFGEDIFTYRAFDGLAYSVETEVTLMVFGVNDAPEIVLPEMFEFDEDGWLEVDFSEYVFDIDGDYLELTYTGNENIYVELAELMVTFSALENWYGEEIITFTVDDGMGRAIASDEVLVVVHSVNDYPVAIAGGPYYAEAGVEGSAEVLLDGSSSYDIDGEIVSWEWSWEGGAGSGEILPAVFAAGEYEVSLTVTDDEGGYDTDITLVSVSEYVNIPPVAVAGGPYYAEADAEGNAEVLLDGSGSYDIDGEIIAWEWNWEGGAGSGETLLATFASGEYEVSLMVTDNLGGSDTDIAFVSVSDYVNIPPVADAGEDQTVMEGEWVQLDGSGSYDPDGVYSREPGWAINPPDFEYNGSIWGVVILDGVEVDETTGILGCFVEEECRGIASFENGSVLDYTVPFGHIIFLPMVYSNVTGGETLTFKYWDANTDMIHDVEETIEWVADMVVGDGINPFEFTVNTISVPYLEYLWTSPEGIELSDPNSMMPSFIAPEVNEETFLTFSLVVSDGEAWSEPDEVVITVLDSNTAPVIELPEYFMFDEDEELLVDFVAEGYIWDPDMDDLALSASGNEEIMVEISGGVVLFYAPENWYGEEVITFTVDDMPNRLTASDDVLVIVNPVNDAPEFTYTEPEIIFNEDESAVVDFAEYVYDVDGDDLSMYVLGAEVIIAEIDGFVITFSAPQDWYGTESIIIGVTDNQDRAVAEVNVDIVVLPVNDAPVIELPDSFTIDQGVPYIVDFSVYVYDIDGDELELTLSGNENIDVMIEGLEVTFNSPDWYGEEELTFTVDDAMGRAIASDVVTVIVRPALYEVEITIGSATVFQDNSFIISVSTSELYDYWNVISFEFDFLYDAESYEYVGYTAGNVPNPNAMLMANNSAPGVVAVAYADAYAMTGYGELISFEFIALNAGISEATVSDFRYNSTYIENIIPGMVEVIDVNHPPVADAGEDISVYEFETAYLDGSGSYDPDGQMLSYFWEAPEGIELDDATSVNPSFVAPEVTEDTEFVFTLMVSDGEYEDIDEVIVTVLNFNHPPVADAGEDQIVNEGDFVQLDGSLSFDEDNDALTYIWEVPAGIFLDNADSASPSFIAPSVNEDTDFEIMLTVSDGEYSDSDIVVITVLDAEIPDIEAEITVTSGEGEPGDPINIEVLTTYIDPIWNVFSYEFFLSYNELELSLDGWSLENTIVDPDGILEVEFLRGVVNFKFTSQISSGGREYVPIEGEGSLINLEFSSLTGGQAQFDIYNFTFNTEEIEVVLQGVINNSAPYVAVAIPEQEVLEDFEPFTMDLNDYIADIDGDELSYEVTAGEGISVDLTGSVIEFASVENYNGTAVVTITAWDGYSDLSTVTTEFDVVVIPVNDPPEINLPEMFTFEEDGILVEDFAPYVYDVDGDELELTSAGGENVFVEINGLIVTFSAMNNWNGSEVITFTVDDGMERATASDEVSVVVTSVNDLPVADAGAPISATAGANGIAVVTLDGSASYDIDGEIVEYHWTWNSGEAYGEIADVELAVGMYTITLTVTDNEGGMDTDNVQVAVAPYGGMDPIAYPDEYFVDEDMVLEVSAEEGLLANDFDDGYPEPLTAIMISEPQIGDFVYSEDNWDGSFVFTAPANWFGVVSFTYVAFDGSMFSDVAEVTITVNSVNDAPVADAGGPYMAEAGIGGTAVISLMGSSYDIDGEVVLYEWYLGEDEIGIGAYLDYEFAVGEYEVILVVTDNEGGIGEDAAEVVVSAYQNIAPVAVDDYYEVLEDMVLWIDAAEGVLANDYDPDNYPGALICVPLDGRLSRNTIVLNEDGSFEFTPTADFFGLVSFEYYVTDGELNSEPATIFIDVISVNDPPEIELPEVFTFEEDGILEIDFSEYINDIDSDYLSLSVSGNEMVTVEINEQIVIFGAVADWFGEELLTFTVSDNEGRLSASDDVLVIVTPVNDAPVINEYLPVEMDITIYEDAAIEFYVDATDVDSELEYIWTFNEEIMPIMGNTFTPEFTEEGDYVIMVEVTDGEYTESLIWEVHYLREPDWQIVTYNNFTMAHGYVTVDGLAADEGDMIGAFVGEECRGIGIVNGSSRVNFHIYGDVVEIVNFKFWDYETDTIYDLDYFNQTYPGGTIGSIQNPLPLAVNTGAGPGWTPVIYTNSTIVYAIVTIEGVDAEEGDLVGAFVGSQCRAVTEVQLMDRTAIASMVVQGEQIETVNFKIWDSSEDIIYNVATTIQSDPGGVVGYPPNEILLNGSNVTEITQTLNLNGGWNLVSLYVRPVDMSVEVIFEPIMDNLLKVKDIYSSYDPNLPSVYNTLHDLEDGMGYYVRVSGVSTLNVTGAALNPTETPIGLNNGWNLVAYVNQIAMPVEDAFAELIANETLIKVKDIFSSYDPNLPPAYNTLSNMEPGKGYYLRVVGSFTFHYPLAVRAELASVDRLCESIWQPVVYTNSMIAYVQIDLADAEGMILGSFINEECRGIARIRHYSGVNIASLVINSEESEAVSFSIYDPATKDVYNCNETITTMPGEDYNGMPTLTVNIPGDEDIMLPTVLKGVYPNPFNPVTYISFHLEKAEKVDVKIFNVRGQLVRILTEQEFAAGEHKLSWDGTTDRNINCTSGVYFIKFTAGAVQDVQKAILMK
jgi:chitodextrinase